MFGHDDIDDCTEAYLHAATADQYDEAEPIDWQTAQAQLEASSFRSYETYDLPEDWQL